MLIILSFIKLLFILNSNSDTFLSLIFPINHSTVSEWKDSSGTLFGSDDAGFVDYERIYNVLLNEN